ncbi:MAG: FHA domain-containing protein [Gammaproteobacteria bacterium]|nr:FHA domain-containing protein [Gammaproteobacteria bacterium]
MTRKKTNAKPATERDAALLSQSQGNSHSGDHQSDDSVRSPNASYSLGRLEQDLQHLQSKWQAVEQDMHDRDQAIAVLEIEIANHKQTAAALEAELAEAKSDKASLRESLADAHSNIRSLTTEVDGHNQTLRVKDDALTTAHDDSAALKRQLGQLQDDFDRHKKEAANADVGANKIKTENTELRMSIQELQDYIDGRKGDWDKLNDQLTQYQDTIEGMSDSLESHDKIVSEKEYEKAALALKVMELERNLSELKGRYAEKEASHADLQQTIENQSRELGRSNSEATKLQKDIEKLSKKLERRDATVASLRKDRKNRDRDSTSLEDMLAGEKATVEKLLKNLDTANLRIADLEAEQEEKKTSVDEVNAKASGDEIRVAELEALLLETESAQNELQKELDAQCELVKVLEDELSNEQENFESLDCSVDRLSAIGSGIRALDEQIEGHRHQPRDEEIQHMIVVDNPFTGAKARYPIYTKEITIGRSSENDIFLDSKYISRVHARIKIDGSKVIIEDAGSKNGFLVNSVFATRRTLKNGDRLEIGTEELRYLNLAPETDLGRSH